MAPPASDEDSATSAMTIAGVGRPASVLHLNPPPGADPSAPKALSAGDSKMHGYPPAISATPTSAAAMPAFWLALQPLVEHEPDKDTTTTG